MKNNIALFTIAVNMQHKAGKGYVFTQKDIDYIKRGAIYAGSRYGYVVEIGKYTDHTVEVTIKDVPESDLQTAQKDVASIISSYVYVLSEDIRKSLRAGRMALFKKPEEGTVNISKQN